MKKKCWYGVSGGEALRGRRVTRADVKAHNVGYEW